MVALLSSVLMVFNQLKKSSINTYEINDIKSSQNEKR